MNSVLIQTKAHRENTLKNVYTVVIGEIEVA